MLWYSISLRADASSSRTALGKKLAHRDAKGLREVTNDAESGISLTSFDTADVGPVSPASDRELFLGPTSLFAKLANASAECDRGRRHNRIKAGMKTMFLETISIVH
jgi:hypothetical protein